MRKLLVFLMVFGLSCMALAQTTVEDWKVLSGDSEAPAWMSTQDARGIDYNASSFWNGRDPSVSEAWIIKAVDADAPAWMTSGNARGVDINTSSTHGMNTVVFADNAAHTVHIHDAQADTFMYSMPTTNIDALGWMDPYRVAVTKDGQIFANAYDGKVVRWADDDSTTEAELVIDPTANYTGNSRALEVVGTGNDVRVFVGKGDSILVYDDDGAGNFVEVKNRHIATGWADECESIASVDSNKVFAAQWAGGSDQTVNRRIYELTDTAYVNNESLVDQLPYNSWFMVQGIDVGEDYYVISESGGSNDGFSVGTVTGGHFNPISADTDGDNVYDAGMNSPSEVTDVAFDSESGMVYWTAAGTDSGSGIGALRLNEYSGNTIAIADDDNNTIHINKSEDGGHLYDLSNEGLASDFWTASAVAPYRVAVSEDGQIFANTFDGKVVHWENDADTTKPEVIVDLSGETGNSRSIEVVGTGHNVTLYFSKGTDIRVFQDDETGNFVENTDMKIATGFGDEAEAIAAQDSNTVWIANASGGVENRGVWNLTDGVYEYDSLATESLPYIPWFVAQGLDVDVQDSLYILGEAGGGLDGIAVGLMDGTNFPPMDETLDNDGDGVYDAAGLINSASLVVDVALDPVNNQVYWSSAGSSGGMGKLSINMPVPTISIAEAKVDADSNDTPDKLDEEVTIKGVITSPNYGYNSQYYLQDETAGIVLYSNEIGYDLNIGDEVEITGVIGQYQGLTQIVPVDSADVEVVNTGVPVAPTTIDIADIGEEYESMLIQLERVKIVDISAWPPEGENGYSSDILVTDGVDTVGIFIDKETELDGWTPPTGWMNLTALCDQYGEYSLRGTLPEHFESIQEPDVLHPYWGYTDAGGNKPDYIGINYYTRGMAYGRVDGEDRVYVATRNGEHRIYVYDAMTGDSVNIIKKPSDYTQGYFPINAVDVSDDGKIFVCNMTLDATADAPFRVYRWDSETADPTVAIEYDGGGRLGDMFSVYGSVEDNSIAIYAAEHNGDKIVKFTTDDNGESFTAEEITMPSSMGSIANIAEAADGSMWIKSAGHPLIHRHTDGTMDTVDTDVVSVYSSKIKYIKNGDEEILGIYYYGAEAEYVDIIDITNGAAEAEVIATTPSIGNIANINGTGSVDFKMVDENTALVFLLGTNNGIAAFTNNPDFMPTNVLSLFYGDTKTLHENPYGAGYITGMNGYGDLGKYQLIDSLETDDKLYGFTYYFGYKDIIGKPDTVDLVVRDMDEANDGAPGSLLKKISVSTEDIDTSGDGSNSYRFISPVEVSGPTFLGYEWDEAVDDTLALFADADGEGEGANRAWEKFDDGSYNDFGTNLNPDFSWDLNADLWIEALYLKAPEVGLDEDSKTIPQEYKLSQNYPNPFNPVTNIQLALPKTANVKLTVYNLLGQKVATVYDGMMNAGNHQIRFNASKLSSGIYFYRIKANSFTDVKKMTVLK